MEQVLQELEQEIQGEIQDLLTSLTTAWKRKEDRGEDLVAVQSAYRTANDIKQMVADKFAEVRSDGEEE